MFLPLLVGAKYWASLVEGHSLCLSHAVCSIFDEIVWELDRRDDANNADDGKEGNSQMSSEEATTTRVHIGLSGYGTVETILSARSELPCSNFLSQPSNVS